MKSTLNNFNLTLRSSLFGAIKLTKNADIDQYKYGGYVISLDSKGTFSFLDGSYAHNVIIFGADMSSSVHANNITKIILIFGEGFTQGLDDTTLYAGKKYSINFTKTNTKFCLSLHYNGDSSYLFVNGTEIIKFKAKDSEIAPYPLSLGNVSQDFSINTKKSGLYGHVYDFSVDYNAIAAD